MYRKTLSFFVNLCTRVPAAGSRKREIENIRQATSAYSKSVMVSVAMSTLGSTELTCIEPSATRTLAVAKRPCDCCAWVSFGQM